MNSSVRNTGAAVLLCGAAWAFGYLVGTGRSPSGAHSTSGNRSATPFPDAPVDPDAKALSATAIGRLFDVKSDFRRQARLYDYADSLDAAAMPGAVNEAMQLPLQYRNGALTVLFARWVEVDPEGAVKYAHLLPKSVSNYGFLRRTAMGAWAEKDFDSALSWARDMEPGDARRASLTVIAGIQAKTNPAEALRLIKDNFPLREAGGVYESVFSLWAENDFASALAAAQELEDLQFRPGVLGAVLTKRSETDPRAVLQLVAMLKTSEHRSSVARLAMERWIERDLSAAREYAMGLPAGESRDMHVRTIAKEMGRRDPQQTLAWMDQVPEAERSSVAESLFSVWTAKDHKSAIDAARALPEGRLRDSALSQVVQGLIDTNIGLAQDLVNELPEGSARENALNQVASRWSQIDPKASMDWYLATVPEGRRGAAATIMTSWSRMNPEEALKWATAQAEGPLKQEAIGVYFSQFGRDDPEGASRQIELLSAEAQRAAIPNFIGQWSYRDPEAAAKWATGIKDEKAKANAFSSVAGQWASRDPVATTRWLERLPGGTERDAAVASFSSAASKLDPEGAVAWALTIQSPERQKGTVRDVYSRWLRRDAPAASNWLTSVSISSELRTELQGLAQPKATLK